MATWAVFAVLAFQCPLVHAAAPTVKLDAAVFTGSSEGNLAKFLGIPFAKPPIGDLRLRLPQSIPPYKGSFNATQYGPACSQLGSSLPQSVVDALPAATQQFFIPWSVQLEDSEDCLTINVIKPANVSSKSQLPVVVFIFGGGFEVFAPQAPAYEGSPFVEWSSAIGKPVIFVAMNYRLNGFGFLPGKEIKAAGLGNIGLHDQREGLRWVQKYIHAFGGDPRRVTLMGQSAGAMSTSAQMLYKNGDTEGLFHGAVMLSGAPIPVGDLTNGQGYYDTIVKDAGCSGAAETLECLRSVSYATLKAAIGKTPGLFSYQSISLAYLPRIDGVFFSKHPQKLVLEGKVAKIPFISGDTDDEGTLFALSSSNITTTAQLKDYIKTYFFPKTSDSDLNKLLQLYPDDPTAGSPFDTGNENVFSPQFKRSAAFQGDFLFQSSRRLFVQVGKRQKSLPVLGAVHGSDMTQALGQGELGDYILNFVYHLDPNGGNLSTWPNYTPASKKTMTFLDGAMPQAITKDVFREGPIAFLNKLTLENPL